MSNKTIIAVDTWALQTRFEYYGIHVYAREVLRNIKRIIATRNNLEIRMFVCPSIENEANRFTDSENFTTIPTSLLSFNIGWRMGGSQWAANRIGANGIFSPSTS